MLAGIFGSIVSGFFGGGLSKITDAISDAYKAKLNAANDAERIEADVRIKTLEARRDVLVAESRSPINAIIRAMFALPVAIYYGKIFLVDKVLALGSTDPLSDDLQWTARAILGFYFVFEAVSAARRRS